MLPVELNDGVTLTVNVWREANSKYRFLDEEQEEDLQYEKSVITNDDDVHVYFRSRKKLDYAKLRLIFKTKQVAAVQITKPDTGSKVFYLNPGIQSISSFGNYGGDFVVVLDGDNDYNKLKGKYSCYLKLRTSLVDTSHPFQLPWKTRTYTDGCGIPTKMEPSSQQCSEMQRGDVVDGCGIATTMGLSSQQFREVQHPPGRCHSSRQIHLFVHVDHDDNLVDVLDATLL